MQAVMACLNILKEGCAHGAGFIKTVLVMMMLTQLDQYILSTDIIMQQNLNVVKAGVYTACIKICNRMCANKYSYVYIRMAVL